MRRYLLIAILVLAVFGTSAVLAKDYDLTRFGLQPAENYDFNGETVTIISWTSERMDNYFNDHVAVIGRVEEAEEIFNCKIEWMQTRAIPDTNFNRLMAGESGNDLWHVQNQMGYFQLVAGGAVYPVEEILPDAYWDNLPPVLKTIEEGMKVDGQIWGIGPMEYRPIYGYIPNMTFAAYNKTLFEANSLPDIYELYLAGEWTWEKATEIATKATMDFDGDGINDQWGITNLNIWNVAASNGATIVGVNDDGKVVVTGDTPAYYEALDQLVSWHAAGIVSPSDTFATGNIAMTLDLAGTGFTRLMDNMADEWVLVPFPYGPRLDKNHWMVGGGLTTLLPVNAKDPEALIALKTFLWREEDVEVSEVLAFHVLNQESADVFLTGQKEWNGEYTYLYRNFLATFETEMRQVASGEKSASAMMAELKPVIQANLDDLFNK